MRKDRLKQAMKEKEINLSMLSDMTGIGKSSISQYIHGMHEPSEIRLSKIADALGVSVEWLMGEDEQQTTKPQKEVFLSIKRAAELLRATEQSVREDLKSGEAPFGYAYQRPGTKKYTYRIFAKQFTAYTGIEV